MANTSPWFRYCVTVRVTTGNCTITLLMDRYSPHAQHLKEYEELAEIRLKGESLSSTVLCGDRISQMTKTYNDIDAVTRLLEEKERDLELAARIGQSLLDQNKDLRHRNEQLEQEFSITNETVDHLTVEVLAATDRVTQLRHELSLKSGLLQIYSQDLETDSEAGTPTKEKLFIHNWEGLQKKIQNLEVENVELRAEASTRMDSIDEVEKKELELITDCVRELADTNKQMCHLQEEVAKKTEDTLRQQEEITQLLAQVVDLQQKNRMLVAENEELRSKLMIAKECQNELSEELIEMKEKYGELLAAFQELQEESRRTARRSNPLGMWPYPHDSLASEIESSMGRDSDGYASDDRMSQSRKVFETVKFANGGRFVRQRQSTSSAMSPTYVSSSFNPGTSSKFSSFGQLSSISSHLASDTESAYADSYHTDDESLYSSLSSSGIQQQQLQNPAQRPPGSLAQELEMALRGMEGEGSGPPSSLMSRSSSSLGGQITYYLQQGATPKGYHLPEKLQIVKPLEGSQTLHHWQRLATPHLGALFEVRQGVQVKGGDQSLPEEEEEEEPPPENYSLSDYEEDEDYVHPGKSFVGASSVYTFTNSTILHPSDPTNVTPSYPSLQLSTHIGCELPKSLKSPPSYRERFYSTTSTYSTTQGLARLLNERGIHGMVPTVVNSATDKQVASATPTPAPSPENSRPPSPTPYGPVQVPDLVSGGNKPGLSRNYHLLKEKKRKKCVEGQKTCESKSQQTILSIKLLERLSRIGLENIMATTASSVYHRSTTVPNTRLRGISDDAPLTLTRSCAGSLSSASENQDTSSVIKPDTLPADRGSSLSHPWGKVPSVMKSPASLGLTPGGVAPPLSCMPNPMLQLNCLSMSRDVGTIETLRILRKGGYS